jgi:hypothetical protein
MAHVGEEGAFLPHRLFGVQLLLQQLPPPSLLVIIDPVKIEREYARPDPEQPGYPRQLMHPFHFAAGTLSAGGQKITPIIVPPFDDFTDAVHGCPGLVRAGGCL